MPDDEDNQLDMLHELIDHCIRIKELTERISNNHMKQLVELLLLETGRQFSKEMQQSNDRESTH